MRLRQSTLPVGFFVLSSAWPVPLLVARFSWRGLVGGGLFFGILGAVSCTLVWLAVVGESPSPKRGAVAAALASLLSAVGSLPLLALGVWLLRGVILGQPVDAGPNVVVASMLLGLVAFATSPLAAALGYVVVDDPSLSLPRPKRLREVDRPVFGRTPGTRTLFAALALLALTVSGAAVGQYADPSIGPVGDEPAFAGPDAPAASQVSQAQSRTRAVSHTVVVTTATMGENASTATNGTAVLRHDLERDVVLATVRRDDRTRTHLLTVDGHWTWAGNTSAPRASATRRDRPLETPDAYDVDATLDAPATVLNRTDEHVTIRYATPGRTNAEPIDAPGNRTVRIDADTGRLASSRTAWVREDGVRVVVRVDYERYGRTTVDQPRTPRPSLAALVGDFLHGPLTGDGRLH